MPNKILLIILATASLLLATTNLVQHRVLNKLTHSEIGTFKLEVEIADDDAERAQGLSGREALAPDRGLLFVFDEPAAAGFWMRNMNFPIDIIWIDGAWRVVGITANVSPDSFPQVFYPPEPIKYVLETNAGWALKNNLQIGESVLF